MIDNKVFLCYNCSVIDPHILESQIKKGYERT